MPALIVTNAFGPYSKGDKIEDAAVIAEIRKSENHANVVAINVEDKASAKS